MSFPVAEEVIEKTVAEKVDFVDPWTVLAGSATGIDYDKLIGMLLFIVSFLILFLFDLKFVLVHQKSHPN
jgi:hypothetical protein